MLAAEQPGWVKRLDELHLLTAVHVLAQVLAAILLTMLVRVLIRRVLQRTLEFPGADRGRVEARQRALATALRGALVGVIWSIAVIVIVGEIGVNIGAFVATATVVGGAVAFGAQTLVRDMISGVFVLAEDQYGVGDDVDLGLATGTVERITLRSVRLRDGAGVVWHVPHGGVGRVGNMSKSTLNRLEIVVARSMQLAEIEAVADELCAALSAAPEADELALGVPSRGGVAALADDRIVYRVKVPSNPGAHDEVAALWRRLVVQAFESGRLVAPLLDNGCGSRTDGSSAAGAGSSPDAA